ncbi:hypothetical protein V2J09_020632 [Rumex salicifolius]
MASELCTLTGCEIGIIVFSQGMTVFSFGHPSVHKIIDECLIDNREGTRKDREKDEMVGHQPMKKMVVQAMLRQNGRDESDGWDESDGQDE